MASRAAKESDPEGTHFGRSQTARGPVRHRHVLQKSMCHCPLGMYAASAISSAMERWAPYGPLTSWRLPGPQEPAASLPMSWASARAAKALTLRPAAFAA